MIIYATKEELAAYLDPDAEAPAMPPLATVLVRHASQLVLSAISSAVYATDAEGLPTDEPKRAAVRHATLEQASAWSINGIDPRKGRAGAKLVVTTKAVTGVSVGYGQSAGVQDAIEDLSSGDTLTTAAWNILNNEGLISNRARTGSGGVERFNVEQRYYDPLTGVLDGQ